MKTLRWLFLIVLLLVTTSSVSAADCSRKSEGDADCDAVITISDFEQFRREYTQVVTTKTSDFNSDGVVNLADFETWRKFFVGVRPDPTPSQSASNCPVPYAVSSPWNTKISSQPVYDANQQQYLSSLTGSFGSDPTQFTMPVYEATQTTPTKKITLSGIYSDVISETQLQKKTNVQLSIPIPSGAKPAAGSDSQIIVVNKDTGDEWGFWQVKVNADGSYSAVNGYHYNTSWSGVPPVGFGSRGAAFLI